MLLSQQYKQVLDEALRSYYYLYAPTVTDALEKSYGPDWKEHVGRKKPGYIPLQKFLGNDGNLDIQVLDALLSLEWKDAVAQHIGSYLHEEIARIVTVRNDTYHFRPVGKKYVLEALDTIARAIRAIDEGEANKIRRLRASIIDAPVNQAGEEDREEIVLEASDLLDVDTGPAKPDDSSCCAEPDRMEQILEGRTFTYCPNCKTPHYGPYPEVRQATLELLVEGIKEGAKAPVSTKRAREFLKLESIEQEGSKTSILCFAGTSKDPVLDAGEACEVEDPDRDKPIAGIVEDATPDAILIRVETRHATGLEPFMGKELEVAEPKPWSDGSIIEFLNRLKRTESQGFTCWQSLLNPTVLPAISQRKPVADYGGTDAQNQVIQSALDLPEGAILLVQGPPGTGKTRTTANLVSRLAKLGNSVLVTGPTNVSVDNVIKTVAKSSPELAPRVARFGSPLRVDSSIEDLLRSAYHLRKDGPLFAGYYQTHPVVGTTLASLLQDLTREALPSEIQPYDYVIVDEAGMATLPSTLAAAASGKRVILVGDQEQLSPIVNASLDLTHPLRLGGFEYVFAKRPDLRLRLDTQFRCQPRIMDWSRDTHYEGELLDNPTLDALQLPIDGSLQPVALAWLDTGGLPGNRHQIKTDSQGRSSIYNQAHVHAAVAFIKRLVDGGMKPECIGYISPYRYQASLVKAALLHALGPDAKQLHASTVDSFQGGERNVIVFDVTASNPTKSHDSAYRLNVSLTRAKQLAVVLGDRDFAPTPATSLLYWALNDFIGDSCMDATKLEIPELQS